MNCKHEDHAPEDLGILGNCFYCLQEERDRYKARLDAGVAACLAECPGGLPECPDECVPCTIRKVLSEIKDKSNG